MVNEIVKVHATGPIPFNVKGKTSYDTGVMGQASVGYGLGNGIRFELEGVYASNARTSGRPTVYEQKYGVLANALFDFDIGSPYVFPYAGVGGGYMRLDRGAGYRNDVAAYQGIAGAAFPIPFLVGLSATLDYRFVGLANNKRTLDLGGGERTQIKVLNNLSNIVTVGLRYQFNVTPPPPPPVVAVAPITPAPSRTYLVFFDWDRADLTARARQVIGDAANNAGRVQYTRIEVDGNTDRSGTPAYNLGLSRRRAETVAAELVRDGIPRQSIGIQAFGDTKPLVPTAAGAREPQNRRVEIVIR